MPTTHDDTVSVVIDQREYAAWSNVKVHEALDSFSTVDFSGAFDPYDEDMRRAFRPFSNRDLAIDIGKKYPERLFTGTLMGVTPKGTPGDVTIDCSGYALPGVISDSVPPVDLYPLQFDGMTFKQIAEAVSQPFGLDVEFDSDEGAKFLRVRIDATTKVGRFLSDLAKQRGKVLTNTPDGKVLFTEAVDPGAPVARFREGEVPFTTLVPTFSPQEYYGEITGIAPSKAGRTGSKHTLANPHYEGPRRALAFKANDVDRGTLPAAVAAKMGRMFGNMVSYVLKDLPTWRDPSGNLWRTNTTVTVESPSAMVYRETEVVIRDVYFRRDGDKKSATLGLVLPGAFSGRLPEVLPWD